MKQKYFIFLIIVAVTTFFSCEKDKKKVVFYDTIPDEVSDASDYSNEQGTDYNYMGNENVVSIPFVEKGGVKFVNVSVNGFGFEMIFDTGCSSTLISVAEANYLYQKGYLTDEDILGVSQSQIADGSIVENMVVNLREVIIDGKISCLNVTATVSSNNNAPLLLGNEVLNRVASYSVDNENKVINFNLK